MHKKSENQVQCQVLRTMLMTQMVTVSCGLSRSEGPPLFIAIVEPYLITLRGRTNEVPLYMPSVTLFMGIVIRH